MLTNSLLKLLFPPTLCLYTFQQYTYLIIFFTKGYILHSFSTPLFTDIWENNTLAGKKRQGSVSKFLIRSHESLIQITLKYLNVKARTSINLKGPWFELRAVHCVLPLCALGALRWKIEVIKFCYKISRRSKSHPRLNITLWGRKTYIQQKEFLWEAIERTCTNISISAIY
jgi:hypothetical protein